MWKPAIHFLLLLLYRMISNWSKLYLAKKGSHERERVRCIVRYFRCMEYKRPAHGRLRDSTSLTRITRQESQKKKKREEAL